MILRGCVSSVAALACGCRRCVAGTVAVLILAVVCMFLSCFFAPLFFIPAMVNA
jgi:pyruvate formate-lyase activating enzyme-like uncharacterized protein